MASTSPDMHGGANGATLEKRVSIDASADAVWRLIEDVAGWSAWNPLYAQATGVLRVGETIDFSLVLPGMKPQRVRAKVVAASPGRRMGYLSTSLGGLVKGDRYVAITPVGPDRCEVANGETFGGLLGPLVARAMKGKVDQAFREMNASLKRAAEAAR